MNLGEFGSWALSKVSVGNPPPQNNSFKGQCVSLIQQYLYQVFGMPFKARGNAWSWAYNIPSGFIKLPANTKLQSGDILVYGKNYGGGYGHIALIDINGKFYDQNGIKALKVAYRDKPFSGYVCVLRPKEQSKVKPATTKTTVKAFKVRVDKSCGAYVRKLPKTSAALSGSQFLNKGDVFVATEVVKGENIQGNDKWFHSQVGNYVWSGGLKKL